MPNPKVWLVCTTSPKTGKLAPLVLAPVEVEQEDYVETEDQEEALVNVFTSPGAADRYRDELAADGELEYIVKRIGWDDFIRLMKGVLDAYQIVRKRSVRFDIYGMHVTGLTTRREILYSRWVTKH